MACQNHYYDAKYYYDQYGYNYPMYYPTYTTTYTPTTVTPTMTTSISYNTQQDGGSIIYDPYNGTYPCTHYNIPEYTPVAPAATGTPTVITAPIPSVTSPPSNHRQRPEKVKNSNQNQKFTKTDEEIIVEVMKLAEFALSNQGLTRGPYLLRQLSRSPKGFISLKLIASDRQIRKVTRNIQLINEAIRRSTLLELSEDGHKVRRIEAVPENLTKRSSISTVLAIRVSESDAEIEKLSSIFKKFGKIEQMRVIPPEKKLPSYLLGYATQVPELGRDLCAIIEYEESLAAMAACKAFHHSRTEAGMCVALLGPRIKRSLYGNRRISNGSLSCQSSVISSLDVSLEECVISSENITDTDSGFHQTEGRDRIPSGQSTEGTSGSSLPVETKTSTPVASGQASPLATQRGRTARHGSLHDSGDSS